MPPMALQAWLAKNLSYFGLLLRAKQIQTRSVNCTIVMSSSRRVFFCNKKKSEENRKTCRQIFGQKQQKSSTVQD